MSARDVRDSSRVSSLSTLMRDPGMEQGCQVCRAGTFTQQTIHQPGLCLLALVKRQRQQKQKLSSWEDCINTARYLEHPWHAVSGVTWCR